MGFRSPESLAGQLFPTRTRGCIENYELKETTIRVGETPANYNISVTNVTFDRIAKTNNAGDALSLYVFYTRTCKYQVTDQIYCTTGFVAKGLKWSKYRVIKAKKTLLSLGLIEDFNRRTKDKKTIAKWYIKVFHLVTGEVYSSKSNPVDPQESRFSNTNASELKDKCLGTKTGNACRGFSCENQGETDEPPF